MRKIDRERERERERIMGTDKDRGRMAKRDSRERLNDGY